ncbi:hypothetical protein [Jiulongibacter sp. NS-SX5]|uniref:hypothetical protein n=1 Tax=Jiulongibacter sp. NS-SX5 TaxID=3463854 RepID=UPI0040592EA7
MKYLFLSMVMMGLFFSCEKEPILFEYRIASEAVPYVEDFFKEGDKRGVYLRKVNLIVEFTDSLENDLCGQCIKPRGRKSGQRKVLIQRNSDCWNSKHFLNKEALIFHELGHCLLDRDHKEDLFPSGDPVSLMTKVLNGPYQPCVYVFGDDEYIKQCNRTTRRDYYLDELFYGSTGQVPDWGTSE